jgi:hypothetical protein
MTEPNKRPIPDETLSPSRPQSSYKKTDTKETPTKAIANGNGFKMTENEESTDAAEMETDVSIIQQEDSIWSNTSTDHDEPHDDTEIIQFDDENFEGENPSPDTLTNEQVQDIVQKFGKIGFITHKDDDSVIQSLANFFGIQLHSDSLDKTLVTSYILAHQTWFKDNNQEHDSLNMAQYKILARCIGLNLKRLKKLPSSQLKKKVRTRFLKTNANQEHVVAHIQHLSKLNGIFFPKGTISDEEKLSFINKMVHSIDKGTYSIISCDSFSIQKIQGFVQNANNKGTALAPKLVNPYVKKSTQIQPNGLFNLPTGNIITPVRQIQQSSAPNAHTASSTNINDINRQTANNSLTAPSQTEITTAGSSQTPSITNNTNQNNTFNPKTVRNGGSSGHGGSPAGGAQIDNHTTTKFSRIELRLCMSPNENDNGDIDQLRRQLSEVLTRLLQADPHIRVWSWYERNEDSPIGDVSSLPQEMRSLNRYFNRLYPTKYGMVHGEFRMEHSRRWEDIIHEMTPWLSEHRHGMYYQHLQCPNTTNLGWLLWSFRKIDIEVLQMELMMTHGINVSLRYQNIVVNRGPMNSQDKVMALHVISDKVEADRVAAVLKAIYPFDKQMPTFPLGIVLRFIPHAFRVKRDKLQKISRLRARQGTFLQAIENPVRPMNATSWEILTLDTNRATFGTLRQRIMEVRSRDRPDDKLFLSVDTSFFRSNEVIFTFLPRHETEARAFVGNIVPFFLHTFSEDILQDFFHSEALARAKSVLWNAETREVESADDVYLNNHGDGVDDFDMLEEAGSTDVTNAANTASQPQMERMERLFFGDDSDSIGTLFTNNQNGTGGTGTQIGVKLLTPIVPKQTRGGHMSGNSVGGHSSGTTFTNEEASQQIILLTEGLTHLKLMFLAVMQQQGISIDITKIQTTNYTGNPLGHEHTPAGSHLGNDHRLPPAASTNLNNSTNNLEQAPRDDGKTDSSEEEMVDQCDALANQGHK